MADSQPRIAALQRRIARLSQPRDRPVAGRVAIGLEAIDARIGGGLVRGCLHEVVASEADDAAAGAGFASMLGRRIGGAIVWLRVGKGDAGLYPPGLSEVGVDPDSVLLVLTADAADLLRAAGEVTRCSAVGVAVIELWGDPGRIDLTASRRLALAAEGSGVTPLLLRIAADPVPSAARTRWGVRAAPSTPLAADAPGMPALDLELLRQRGGPAGWCWRVEWDRDEAIFRTQVSGDLAAVSGGGSAGDSRVHAA